MNSLERSLQAGLIVSLLLLMLLFWWTGSLASRLLTESLVFSRLEADATNLLAAIDFPDPTDTDARPRLGNPRLGVAYEQPQSGKYYVAELEDDLRFVSPSGTDLSLGVPSLTPGQQRRSRVTGASGETLLLWSGGFSQSGHELTIGIAEDYSPIQERLQVFQWYFGAISIVLLLVLLAVQHLIVRHSVQKLDAIRRDMLRLEQGRAGSLSEDVPTEVLPLVREFNRLLTRFDQRLRLSRNAVGNLAHALKGPLNLLLRGAESTAGTAQDREQALVQNAERVRQVIESELKRARLAGRGAVGQLFDLDAELPALSGLMGQVYADKNVDVRFTVGRNVELAYDRQDMLELIGNLLDNAVKWADSVVMVNIRRADGVLLDVEDDGPGCSPAELKLLTRRGVRLDESVAGHGLGLSIVKDIVDTYDGTLEFGESSRLGGLRASVYLPDSQ